MAPASQENGALTEFRTPKTRQTAGPLGFLALNSLEIIVDARGVPDRIRAFDRKVDESHLT